MTCQNHRLPRTLMCVVAGLAAMLALPHDARPQARDAARPVGPCTVQHVCGFDDPEDLAEIPGTPWLIVGEATGLIAFNTRSRARIVLATGSPDPACPTNSKGGGISVGRAGAAVRLLRIVHADQNGQDAVETYSVDLVEGRPRLRRSGCVIAPRPYFLNDIALLPDGGFAATHMFDRAQPRAQREAAFLASRPTGFVVRWSTRSGWQRLGGTDGSFPNGIALSQDGQFLAFAETYGHAMNRVRLDGSDRRRLPVAMNPDNITALPHGRFSVAGGTGTPLVSTRACPGLRRPGCGFPARALRIDFGTGRTRILASSGGRTTPGFSVALLRKDRLYLGTAFGDRLTIVPVTKPPRELP